MPGSGKAKSKYRAKMNNAIEEEEEKEFEKKLSAVITREEIEEFWTVARQGDIEKTNHIIKKHAEAHGVRIPEHFERQLRNWNGENAYSQIKKIDGAKYALEIIEHIHNAIPLSIKGFEIERERDTVYWTRESDRKTFKLYIPISKETQDLEPAAGDLAKRVIFSMLKFGYHRKTADPGPILFKELLETLGMIETSQEQRKRIKRYCEASAYTHMTVRQKNEKDKEILFKYVPFFKKFTWSGNLENNAKIYPVFNEHFERLLIEENISQYIFLFNKRLKPLPQATDRDRLAQDNFRMLMGLPAQRIRMRNWLSKYGQFTETELETKSLKYIKEFVNKNFALAQKDGLLQHYQIQKLRNKPKYLNQVINIFPVKPKKISTTRELTPEEIETVERFIELAYNTTNLYSTTPEELNQEYVENYIRKHGREIVEQALGNMENEIDDPFYEGAEGPLAHFWSFLQEHRDNKK